MPIFEVEVSDRAASEVAGASYADAAADTYDEARSEAEAAAAAEDTLEAAAQAYAESLNAEAILEINYLFGFDGEHNPPYA